MNVGLGNSDGYRAADAVSESEGRVTLCPLCLGGSNDKIDLALWCKKLKPARRDIKVGSQILEDTLKERQQKSDIENVVDAPRDFLGNTILMRIDYLQQGLALDILVDRFFQEKTKVRHRIQERLIIFNWI